MATKKLSQQSFLNKVFRICSDKILKLKNTILCPNERIFFTFNALGDATYTRRNSEKAYSGYRINFGGKTVAQLAELPNEFFSLSGAKKCYKFTNISIQALYYHEMGHIIYTDMESRLIMDYKDPKYRGFLHSIFNILEDIVIERYCMSVDFPYTHKYFRFIENKMFVEKSMKLYKEVPNDPANFLNFLLLKLRCGKLFTGKHEVWEEHKRDLIRLCKDVLEETNATKRIEKSIVLGEYLIKNTKLDFSQIPDESDEETTAGSTSGGTGTTSAAAGASGGTSAKPKASNPGPVKVDEGGLNPGGGMAPQGETQHQQGGSHQHRSSDNMSDGTKLDPAKASEIEKPVEQEFEDSYDPKNDLLIDKCPEIEDAFNDTLGLPDTHLMIKAKDYFNAPANMDKKISERIRDNNALAMQVCKSLSVFKGRRRPKMNRGHKNGLLDLMKAMQNSITNGCDTKVFKKKVKNGEAPDLAVSILCDNSGSMDGNKSHVCTTAMLSVAKACQLCKIPIEISCFTECRNDVTIRIKTFEDDFDNARKYFGITDSDLVEHYSYDRNVVHPFWGNRDEVNLYYIWKDLLRNEHKDKLLIVISDGETCGSTDTLRKLVQEIKKSGISIIGLGIQSRAVSRIYPEYKLFDTEQSLSDLPKFLTDTLFRFAKGGK